MRCESGPGGSGHYVKMVHNGIEQAEQGTLCEMWAILSRGLGMEYDEIGSVFESWNKKGPISSNFLISTGADVCRTRDPKDGFHVLARVRDKAVQDVEESEGTGVWTFEEIARLHVAAPSIAASHLSRLASADAVRREKVNKGFNGSMRTSKIRLSDQDRNSFIADLFGATYVSFLVAFVQGMHLIQGVNQEQKWNIDLAGILQLWRGGCIIQSDYIADVLEKALEKNNNDDNLLLDQPEIGEPLMENYPALKMTLTQSIEVDQVIPSLSASLEYIKSSGSTDLQTQFLEAQMDYFGFHMFDLKSEPPGKPVTGSHHFEWMSARGVSDEKK